jgi:hypothetical protein
LHLGLHRIAFRLVIGRTTAAWARIAMSNVANYTQSCVGIDAAIAVSGMGKQHHARRLEYATATSSLASFCVLTGACLSVCGVPGSDSLCIPRHPPAMLPTAAGDPFESVPVLACLASRCLRSAVEQYRTSRFIW